jgi:hypothetical protein
VAAFGSPEWLARRTELGAALPAGSGPSARIVTIVAGAPGGEVRYGTVLDGGRLVPGEVAADDADVTLTLKHPDALAALRGETDLNALFMQGRMKVTGPTGLLLDVLAHAQSDAVADARAALAADTD